jgi:hypothetical protein
MKTYEDKTMTAKKTNAAKLVHIQIAPQLASKLKIISTARGEKLYTCANQAVSKWLADDEQLETMKSIVKSLTGSGEGYE